MTLLIGILYFSLDALLAATLARRRPGVHFISFFMLLFAGGAFVLYGLVLCHLPLNFSFALICALKLAYLGWRFTDLKATLQTIDWRDAGGVIIFILCTTVFVTRKGLIFWDDWSNWAYVAKILWHYNGLPVAHPGIYYDYMLLQSFYWSAFHFPGEAFENKLGVAITWLVYVIGMLRFIPNRLAYMTITICLPFAFSVEVFGTTYTDGITALAFALLSVDLWETLEADEQDRSYIKPIGPLLLLLFAKPVGVYLALIALIAVGLVLVASRLKPFPGDTFKNNNAVWRHAGRLGLLFLGIIVVKAVFVKLFLWQIGAEEAQVMKRNPLEAWQAGYYHAYLRAVRESIFVNERFVFVLPASILLNLALLPASLRLNRVLYFFLALAGNAAFIILASISFFSEQEIRRAASFARYLEHVYVFGIVLLVDSGRRIYGVLQERFNTKSAPKSNTNPEANTPGTAAQLALASVVLVAVYFFGGFAYYHYKHAFLKQTIRTAKECSQQKGRFYLIAQNDSGLFYHVARLYVYPKTLASHWQFCPGDKNAEGYICTPTPDRASFQRELNAYDYVLLVKDDAYLKEKLWPQQIPYPTTLPACVDVRELKQ